ncbi:MAG: dihydropteroate synthase [Candidatus Cryptobacteroides sp.]
MMKVDREIEVMGIINLTDNSYFPESRCLDVNGNDDMAKVLGRASAMVSAGAAILDIGACSTRPGSTAVGEDEEWRRLEPALQAVRSEFPKVKISVDTYWPSVVRKVYDLIGDFIVNDVTAGNGMSGSAVPGEMLRTVGKLGLTYVAMHMRGNPANMQSLTDYDNVTEDISAYFRDFARKSEDAGVKDWILDPGFGFAKTVEQNYQLLRELGKFTGTGRKILVGVSRKSLIYRRFDITPEESLPATQVLHYKALCEGADILRVHDVAEAVRTVALYRTLESPASL